MRLNPFRGALLFRIYLEACLKRIMEQHGTATLARARVSTLRVGSPKEEYFCNRAVTAVSASLSKSWSSGSCNLSSPPFQDQSLLMDDISPLMDMERELYGGSNESLAEQNFGVEILSSQDSSSSEGHDQELERDAQGEDISEDDLNLDEYVIAEISSEEEEEEEEEEVSNEGDMSFSPSISTLASMSRLSLHKEEPIKVVPIKYHITTGAVAAELSSPAPSPKMSSTATKSPQGPSMKPPNVLIYTGHIKPGEEFELIKYRLQKCLDPDSYLIYFLSSAELDKVPWKDNAALLVLFSSDLDDVIRRHALEFCLAGGRCINFFWGAHSSLLSSVQQLEDTVPSPGGDHVQSKFVDKDSIHTSLRPHMLHVMETRFPGGGKALIFQQDLVDNEKDYPRSHERRLEVLRLMLTSKLGIFCVKRPLEHPLTPCYLIHRNHEDQNDFQSKLSPKMSPEGKLPTGNDVTLHFLKEAPDGTQAPPLPEYLPVRACLPTQLPSDVPFDATTYFAHLRTRQLGRHVFYTQVIPTTMNLLEGLTDFPGAIAIAQRQIQGKGRGGNNWVSPEGCAMFTLFLSVPLHSHLGHSLPFLQHIVSIALVHSVRSKASLKDLDLRLKWPNDIYFGRQAKLGGIIIKTYLLKDIFHCFVGCGVNVSNSQPTLCINDLIREHNQKLQDAAETEQDEVKSELPLLSVEEYIASSLTQLEYFIDDYQSNGPSACLPLYYKYWCHEKQEVTLGETNEKAMIEGIDDNGFLLVTTSSGQVKSLQPDGNSFDLLKNLITIKAHP